MDKRTIIEQPTCNKQLGFEKNLIVRVSNEKAVKPKKKRNNQMPSRVKRNEKRRLKRLAREDRERKATITGFCQQPTTSNQQNNVKYKMEKLDMPRRIVYDEKPRLLDDDPRVPTYHRDRQPVIWPIPDQGYVTKTIPWNRVDESINH